MAALFNGGLELYLASQDLCALNSILLIDVHWFAECANEAEACIAHGGARLSANGNA
jgi:hypothetical protein